MKIISFYLPQYHEIPENNKWWGKGFTEWENLKKAKPLFKDHNQPRVPYEKKYYNLLDDEVKKWQIQLAKDNGVYGFCFYHYWFDGHLLLEKPTQQFLQNKELDIPFCLSWANEPWTKAWVSKSDKILIDQRYGAEKEWKEHFDYLTPYFLDDRYIKNEGKPFFVIYRPNQIECLNDMIDAWQRWAKEIGLPGIDFAYQQIDLDLAENSDTSRFKYNIEFQPIYALEDLASKSTKKLEFVAKKIDNLFEKTFSFKPSNILMRSVRTYSYDDVWKKVLERKPYNNKCIPGVFTDWDNTPRRKEKGRVFLGANPEKFKKYMKDMIIKAREEYNKDMIFLTAWNEWSEGCYLEPDEKNKDAYLKAIKEALIETSEFPNNDWRSDK